MNDYKTIEVQIERKVGYLVLNRPERHNALNALMISEIRKAINFFSGKNEVRVIVIKANGKSFSSGADLHYMKEQAGMSQEDNLEDSKKLAWMFFEIYSCPKPVVTFSFGVIAGGANGIIAASDYALTLNDSVFSFSEVRLGLVPATISPYIIDRIGRSRAMELLLSGRSFSGEEAEKLNLVNKSVEKSTVEQALEEILGFFMRGAPRAIHATKELLLDLNKKDEIQHLIDKTSSVIALARSSDEGKEGIKSFFEKRKAKWIDADI